MSPTQRFWNLLKLYRRQIRRIYTYAIFIGIVNLTLPLGIQAIVSFLQTGVFNSTWLLLVGFVLVGIAITGIMQVYQLRVVENIQQDIFARSGLEFAYRLPEIKYIDLDKIHAPELANRFFDTLTVQKGLPKILIDFSLALFQIIFGLLLLTIYSPYFIILGFVMALVFWLVIRVTGPSGLSTSLGESKMKYRLAFWLEEIARVSRTFKVFNAFKFHLNKTDDITSDYLQNREKHVGILKNQFWIFVAFKVLVASILLLLGGFLVFQERMNIGQFVAAEIIIILILNSIEKIIRSIDTVYDVLTALEKIGYVTDLELDDNSGRINAEFNQAPALKVDNISFQFPDASRKVISNLSFEIPASNKVFIDGSAGSGKSILLQLLAGIYTVDEGQILLDGASFYNYNRDELNTKMAVGFEETQIFEASIRDNILVGREVSEMKLNEIIDGLGLRDYVLSHREGLDANIDSSGRRMASSVAQRILMARLLVGEPTLILLDDPLNFLDDEDKNSIIDYLTEPTKPWTLVVASSYPYWQDKCQQNILLNRNNA